ncbi:MAG: XisI protein [Acidobacteria bacterium]|nr:XisI protein [Acidobacteriota bacterium]MBI3422803.1 XisI protein [Acidobacteriota bacterium]
MERVTEYRRLIRQIMEAHARPAAASFPATGVEKLLIMDEERGHYLLLKLGWQGHQRIEWTLLHVRLKDGQIWIEHDLTEDGIATELLAAGVPQDDIVLAFHLPELRQYVEFTPARTAAALGA